MLHIPESHMKVKTHLIKLSKKNGGGKNVLILIILEDSLKQILISKLFKKQKTRFLFTKAQRIFMVLYELGEDQVLVTNHCALLWTLEFLV